MGARDAYLARGLPLHFQVEEAVRQGVTKARPSGSGHGSSSSTDITESADTTDELRCNFRRQEARGYDKVTVIRGVPNHPAEDFGSEGWGFESLRARYVFSNRNPLRLTSG
jgi:hypothetical protein